MMRGNRKSGQVAHRCEFDTDCMNQDMYKQAKKDGVPRRCMRADCRSAVRGQDILRKTKLVSIQMLAVLGSAFL